MNKFTAYSQIGFAILLYVLSALTFFDYMYSLVIPDTVTAVENAFGKLVILIFMLVMAKFSMASGREKLKTARSDQENESAEKGSDEPLDTDQTVHIKEADK